MRKDPKQIGTFESSHREHFVKKSLCCVLEKNRNTKSSRILWCESAGCGLHRLEMVWRKYASVARAGQAEKAHMKEHECLPISGVDTLPSNPFLEAGHPPQH